MLVSQSHNISRKRSVREWVSEKVPSRPDPPALDMFTQTKIGHDRITLWAWKCACTLCMHIFRPTKLFYHDRLLSQKNYISNSIFIPLLKCWFFLKWYLESSFHVNLKNWDINLNDTVSEAVRVTYLASRRWAIHPVLSSWLKSANIFFS